jgi:hypothetical protein
VVFCRRIHAGQNAPKTINRSLTQAAPEIIDVSVENSNSSVVPAPARGKRSPSVVCSLGIMNELATYVALAVVMSLALLSLTAPALVLPF